MAGELFKSMAGVQIVHIPHKGSRRSAHQRHERPGRNHARCDHDHGADGARGPGPGAGHDRRETSTVIAGRADDSRGGRKGLRGDDLARHHGAGRHAQTHSRPAQCRNRQDRRAARRQKSWNEQGAEPMAMTPAEFEKYLNADIAKWAQRGEGCGRQAGLGEAACTVSSLFPIRTACASACTTAASATIVDLAAAVAPAQGHDGFHRAREERS